MPTADKDARFWDRIARRYAARPVGDTAGYERTLERTRHYLKPTDEAIEFGCGSGTTALKLAPSVARYVATDFSHGMIAIGQAKAEAQGALNVTFAVATPDTALYDDASFDVALAFNVLHLVPALAHALRAVHRLLKPGGLFISKTPCGKEFTPLIRWIVRPAQWLGLAPFVAFFTAEELEREIVAAGFDIVERDRHGTKKKQERRIFLVARKR
jgi:ubiquinone/menaquinone biosynthesis C-methylase UbiE